MTRIEQCIAKLREARGKANKDIYGSQDFAILSANVWAAMVDVIEASTDIRMQYNPSRSGEHGPALERFWHARNAFETAVLGAEK